MPIPSDRAARRDRHAAEIEESQAALRESIAETERLVDESEAMLRRQRKECEDADGLSEKPTEAEPGADA
jgi:hypothetical protein